MEVLAALGLGAKELFNYNRENFKFDQDQRIEREALRLEMQVKRFELFREDVRDLVELTVDRMDVYHLVGALFLEFCIVLFCEGRVQANAPPFLLSLFLLSNACAFIYLLLAVWLSMHASIASHSFGVRLLTRFVRLPIPGIRQISALRSQLQHFERQGVANLLRLPFQDRQEWKPVNDDEPQKSESAVSNENLLGLGEDPPPPAPLRKNGSRSYLSPPGSAADLNLPPSSPRNAARSFDPSPTPIGRPSWASSASSPAHGSSECDLPTSEHPLLPEEDEGPFGGEELLASHKGARPERHVQLFRQLQSKWQCYDAYCRVCMGLGVNQILQGLSYYCICHTLVENQSPTTGYALVVLFQCTTVALAVLDLAGLKRHEIIAVQVVGMFPCVLTAWGVAHGRRDANGELDHRQRYILSPLSFLAQVLWLELWLRVAAPSGADQVKLPRRFRQVLFLDVFGDAFGWDGTAKGVQDSNGQNPGAELQGAINQLEGEEDDKDETEEEVAVALRQASSQLTLAECAIRRWRAAPHWALSASQRKELEKLREQLHTWGNTITTEADRRIHADGPGRSAGYSESHVQKWSELTEEEKRADPFATCLVGPFEHDMGYKTSCYHFDVETQQTLFEDDVAKHFPGALVLTLEAVAAIMQDLVKEARALLEVRITADLRAAIRRQQKAAAAPKASVPVQDGRRASKDRVTKCTSSFLQVDLRAAAAVPEKFPNLFSLFRPKAAAAGPSLAGHRQGRKKSEDEKELLANPTDSEDSLNRAASAPAVTRRPVGQSSGSQEHFFPGTLQDAPRAEPRRGRGGRDPVLVAMAGQHAQHFVPERLPWQVLSRMTRVLQVCWLWSGTMAFLKEVGIYQVDFQNHPGGERRLCAAEDLPLEAVPARWPHGDFFHPQGIFFLSADTIAVGSPFAFYVANATRTKELEFEEVARTFLPPSTFLACLPTSQAVEVVSGLDSRPGLEADPPCLFVAPSERRLEVWPLGEDSDGGSAASLSLESGRPWRLATGALLPCQRVAPLLPVRDRGLASWCLLIAGWDGELLPIAAVPLTEGLRHLAKLRSRVRPCLDAPLAAADVGLGVAALHLEPSACRLWAVLANGELLAWDLLRSKELGRWRLSSLQTDGAGTGLRALAATTDQRASLYVLGRKATGGPLLLRGQLPAVADGADVSGADARDVI